MARRTPNGQASHEHDPSPTRQRSRVKQRSEQRASCDSEVLAVADRLIRARRRERRGRDFDRAIPMSHTATTA